MSETSYNVKEPGLNVLPPGVERYVIAGGERRQHTPP